MKTNQRRLPITTHFSQRFESDCTVLSPNGFVPSSRGAGGRGRKKKAECHFLFRPQRSTKGGWWLRSISWRWQVDENVTLISQKSSSWQKLTKFEIHWKISAHVCKAEKVVAAEKDLCECMRSKNGRCEGKLPFVCWTHVHVCSQHPFLKLTLVELGASYSIQNDTAHTEAR